jgi:hypothetical protein
LEYKQISKNYYVIKAEWNKLYFKDKHIEFCACVNKRRKNIVFTAQSACALFGIARLDNYELRPHAVTETHRCADVVRWHFGRAEKYPKKVKGMRVVNPIRAIYDLVGSDSPESILVSINSCLYEKVFTKHKLMTEIQEYSHMKRYGELLRLATFATKKCESPLETRGWIAMYKAQFLMPQQQLVINGARGFSSRVDMYYELPGRKIIVEFDGRSKYTTDKIRWDEKVREDTLRAMGYEFVRIFSEDIDTGEIIQKLTNARIPHRRYFGLIFPGFKK